MLLWACSENDVTWNDVSTQISYTGELESFDALDGRTQILENSNLFSTVKEIREIPQIIKHWGRAQHKKSACVPREGS